MEAARPAARSLLSFQQCFPNTHDPALPGGRLLPRPEHEALAAARARETTDEGRRLYAQRQGVEGTISQAVRAFGLRRSRYVGLAKTGLQQVCTAAAMNASRVVRWLDGVPRARTRVTRFAALAQPA